MKKYSRVLFICLLLLGCTVQQSVVEQETKPVEIDDKNDVPPSLPKESADTEGTIEVIAKTDVVKNEPLPEPAKNKREEQKNKTLAPPTLKPEPKIINGKTMAQRLREASDRLHTVGSAEQIRQDFPDIKLVYTDRAENTGFPAMIVPFRYYYSEETNKTFNICNIDFTVFICNGKLERIITKEDIESKRCEVTPIYTTDPRIGGSGVSAYGSYGYN